MRAAVFLTIASRLEVARTELHSGRVLDAPIAFTWDRLGAGDLQGRTRSYKQLVEAGMDKGRGRTNRGAVLDGPAYGAAAPRPPPPGGRGLVRPPDNRVMPLCRGVRPGDYTACCVNGVHRA